MEILKKLTVDADRTCSCKHVFSCRANTGTMVRVGGVRHYISYAHTRACVYTQTRGVAKTSLFWCFSKTVCFFKKRLSNSRFCLSPQTFELSEHKRREGRQRTLHHEAIAQKRGYVRSRVRSSSSQVPMTCTARVACASRGNT